MNDVTILRHALLIDCTGREPQEDMAVVVEGQRIADVVAAGRVTVSAGATVIDCRGHTLMPGLTDAHVHICAVDVNILEQHRCYPPSLLVAKAIRNLEETLQQGYTTVRDAGGADAGFRMAVEQGLVAGPRLLVSGSPITQTGGHADFRRSAEAIAPIHCCVGMTGVVCDGPDEVRKAVREQLRRGVDQIKIMAGGGAMSPADEIDTTQFTVPELAAAVEETRAVGKYVLAHLYSASSISNALQAGVRSLEHGNLMTAESARLIREAGAYLVPTLTTYEMLAEEGAQYGVPEDNIRKINVARERSFDALKLAHQAGVKIGSGSDLLGPMQRHKARELALKAQVLSPMEALISATKVNAELFRLERHIGTIEAGKLADLILVRGDPLRDLTLLQDYRHNILLVMKEGQIYKNLVQ
ncbi:MAG TPA: amidohydrolase family protein [Alphaproteobacteria bacterium]|nr:amidohydrolase family protein [Alphaproteobacteria bacterium]